MSAYALPGYFPPLETNYSFSSCKPPYPLDDFQTHAGHEEKKIEYEPADRQQRPRVVTVRDAKLDPVRLIKSLMTPSGSPTSSSKRKQQRRNSDPNPLQLIETHESVMEFELSFCMEGGNTCNVVRSLERIRQLRMDLVEEVEFRTVSLDVTIPDVPRLKCTSLGFTLLQDALRCHAPLLEAWFRRMLTLFPYLEHCTAWNDFFVDRERFETCFLRHRNSAPAKLYAIEESEDGSDSEEDE